MQIASNRHGLLLSVQRTGTRFVQRILQQANIKPAQLHAVHSHADRIDVWLKKCADEQLPIVVTLRHPLSVAKSWRHRSEPLEKMFEQWRYLIEICDRCKPYYVPVDHPERDGYLDELRYFCQAEMPTDWHKYGSKPGSADIKLDPAEIQQVNELVATEFVRAFYTEDVPHGT